MDIKDVLRTEQENTPTPPPSLTLQEATANLPFHVHHAVVGAGIVGISALALFIQELKPTTRYAVAGLGAALGLTLIYDDLVQHMENGCDFWSIVNFVPCSALPKVSKIAPPFAPPVDATPQVTAPAKE
jgi:hypothetical protein